MKLVTRSVHPKTGVGLVCVEPEEEDDMYILYNLICIGDVVEASTLRNVVTESKTGAREKHRVVTKIAIKVESIDFDVGQCSLRLKGKNVKENEHLKLGQYHTLELELNRRCSVEKSETEAGWDSEHLSLLEDASDPTASAEIAALVLQEGLAHLCLIKRTLTKTCAKLERSMPKKQGSKYSQAHSTNRGVSGGGGSSNSSAHSDFDVALQKFFAEIYESVKRHVNFDVVKVLAVGSPGFLAEDFLRYAFDRAVREEDVIITKNRTKFLKAHASSGYKRAIEEMLSSAEVSAQLGDVKAQAEVQALESFYAVLAHDPDRACYGPQQVVAAQEQLAVDCLMVTDAFLRAGGDFALRKRRVALLDAVLEHGGKVFKFSSLHVSGEQLDKFTGVAATLRFPLPEIDEEQASVADDGSDSDSTGAAHRAQVHSEMEGFL